MSAFDSRRRTPAQRWMTISDIEIKNLRLHPLNEKIYGEHEPDPELVKSIKELGVLEPILAIHLPELGGPRNHCGQAEAYYTYIVSGHRRFLAAKACGLKRIPTRLIESLECVGSLLEVEQLLIESNRQRVKTPEQKAREFTELKRIETALLKEKEYLRKTTQANLPESSKGNQARDKAAEAVGLKPRTAEKLEAVVKAADNGNPAARAGLDEINKTGRGVEGVFKEVYRKATPEEKEERREEQEARQIIATDIQNSLKNAGVGKIEVQAAKKSGFNLSVFGLSEDELRSIAACILQELDKAAEEEAAYLEIV